MFNTLVISFAYLLFNYPSINSLPSNASSLDKDDSVPGRAALDNFPLIDGHNDLPHNLFRKLNNKILDLPFDEDLTNHSLFGVDKCHNCHTDLARIKRGKLGAQFWVAYVSCDSVNFASRTLDQIDVIKRLVKKYPNRMELVTTADGIIDAFKRGKLASLIGVEGGHSIDNKLSILRIYYDLGVRYLTLTHSCNLPWADASPVDRDGVPQRNLTDFGKKVVREMNRLGMLVDLAHVSHNVMVEALAVSVAPVIFSHSSAHAVYAHHRNAQDDVLLKLKSNGGVIMVNFYSEFIGSGGVTIKDVAEHINHVVDAIGHDHVGIGSDFDGVNSVPKGLEDVSKYPDLFDLLRSLNSTRWSIENLEKLAGRNLFRVFKAVEKIRDQLAENPPDEELIPASDLIRFRGKRFSLRR